MKRLLILLLLPMGVHAFDGEFEPVEFDHDSYFSECIPLYSATAPHQRLSGLTGSTTNFTIEIQADNSATATTYTGAAAILTIATVGTYAAPTASDDIRFGECAISGTYQIQLRDEIPASSGASILTVSFEDGQSTVLDATWKLALTAVGETTVKTWVEDATWDADLDDHDDVAGTAGEVVAGILQDTNDVEQNLADETVTALLGTQIEDDPATTFADYLCRQNIISTGLSSFSASTSTWDSPDGNDTAVMTFVYSGNDRVSATLTTPCD